MTPIRKSLLATVRALLEMTEARGCTEAEAAIAREKAFELMEKYGISPIDLHSPAKGSAAFEANQELDPDEGRTNQFGSSRSVDANAEFASRGFVRPGRRQTVRPVARFVFGYAAVGCVIWAFAALYPDDSPQCPTNQYRKKAVSKAFPIAGSRALSSKADAATDLARAKTEPVPANLQGDPNGGGRNSK